VSALAPGYWHILSIKKCATRNSSKSSRNSAKELSIFKQKETYQDGSYKSHKLKKKIVTNLAITNLTKSK
jgi:hypothetical protein